MSFCKPPGLEGPHPDQWADPAMAAAYLCRPPYGPALTERLRALRVGPGPVLDVGAGTGDVGRMLAKAGDAVHGLEPSAAMIEVGRALDGGDAVRWLHGRAEDVELEGPYALAIAGESAHWLAFDRALPRIAAALAPGAMLAVVSRGDGRPACWPDLQPLVDAFSTNRDYAPYDTVRLLEASGAFEVTGRWQEEPRFVTMTTEAYLTSLHSRNGLGPGHMGAARAAAFDEAARKVLRAAYPDGRLTLACRSRLAWGHLLC